MTRTKNQQPIENETETAVAYSNDDNGGDPIGGEPKAGLAVMGSTRDGGGDGTGGGTKTGLAVMGSTGGGATLPEVGATLPEVTDSKLLVPDGGGTDPITGGPKAGLSVTGGPSRRLQDDLSDAATCEDESLQ